MIYDKSGNQLHAIYNKSGQPLNMAYAKDGMQIFPDGPITLKVMTYNVGGWYDGRGTNVPADKKSLYYALQTGMIEENDPDVLVIQEYLANFSADGTSALTMLQNLFPYVHVKTSGTYFGRAICSKYPITNYVERTYTAESSRYFDSCTITVNGIPITFVNTHLGLTQENRNSEIQQLIPYLETLNTFIACGDYNAGIKTSDTTDSYYINNVKPFLDAGFRSANYSDNGFLITASDEPQGTYNAGLDNMYLSPNITVESLMVDTTKRTDGLSDIIDHMPLIAEMQIN